MMKRCWLCRMMQERRGKVGMDMGEANRNVWAGEKMVGKVRIVCDYRTGLMKMIGEERWMTTEWEIKGKFRGI